MKSPQSALDWVEFVYSAEDEADNITVNTPGNGENATVVAHLLERKQTRKIDGAQQRADAPLLPTERYLQTPTKMKQRLSV